MHKILLIDDELQVRKALLYRLKSEIEFEALEAGTGERGLVLYKEHTPDLILSDVNMPGQLDGFMLASEILRINPEAQVVLMTGIISQDTEEKALATGAKELIAKPIETEDVNRILRYLK